MLTAKKIMTQEVVCIRKEASVLEAYKLMFEKKVRHLPVTEKDGTVTGMLSDRDVQRAMVVDRSNGEKVEEIFLTTTKKVAEYMTPIAFTALSDTPMTLIIEEMMAKKISAVIIVDETLRCEGIVTSNDIMRVFLDHMARDREIFEKPISFFYSNTLF